MPISKLIVGWSHALAFAPSGTALLSLLAARSCRCTLILRKSPAPDPIPTPLSLWRHLRVDSRGPTFAGPS